MDGSVWGPEPMESLQTSEKASIGDLQGTKPPPSHSLASTSPVNKNP